LRNISRTDGILFCKPALSYKRRMWLIGLVTRARPRLISAPALALASSRQAPPIRAFSGNLGTFRRSSPGLPPPGVKMAVGKAARARLSGAASRFRGNLSRRANASSPLPSQAAGGCPHIRSESLEGCYGDG
jgi:hypothetical protein